MHVCTCIYSDLLVSSVFSPLKFQVFVVNNSVNILLTLLLLLNCDNYRFHSKANHLVQVRVLSFINYFDLRRIS